VAVSDGMAFRDGTAERDVTLRMARILKKKLLAEGYDVLMVRDGKDVQLDNVARTVICNNVADCHIALHWDSDGLSYDKGCFYASVPKQLKNRKPVASYWKEHDALGKALIKGLRSKKVKISGTGAAEIDLTQTSYSTIPSVDIELGNQCSDHSDKKMEKLADGLLRGINSYAKKYIHVAPLSSL
jgi:N-acetylmuramoyl-L-alanine amidase